MKSLKPSLRENKRYLLVVGKDLQEEIEKAILSFIGILGMSKVGLSFIEKKYLKGHEKDSVIICVNREMVDLVRASFCVWDKKISVEKVSGTLKSLRR